jgi:hypothetical protein
MNLRETGISVLDAMAQWTGVRIVRAPLWHPLAEDVTTLDIPGYRQVDSYSCGAVVGLMLVHTWHPHVSPRHVYDICGATESDGTPTGRLVRALRQCGVGVSVREKMTFGDIVKAIEDGFPVATTVRRPESQHWVLVYGVGRRPDRVYLAANSFPVVGRTEYTLSAFAGMWEPHGLGLVCWGKSPCV